MAGEQTSLRDLIESRAAYYGVATRTLWKWALDVIAKDVLRPVLPEGQTLDTEFSHGGMSKLTLREVIKEAERAIERYDPSNDNWAKTLMFDPAGFDSWLREILQAQRIAVRPKRPAGRKRTVREKVALFIDENYAGAIPGDKTIVRDIKTKIGLSVSERTIRRALGRA